MNTLQIVGVIIFGTWNVILSVMIVALARRHRAVLADRKRGIDSYNKSLTEIETVTSKNNGLNRAYQDLKQEKDRIVRELGKEVEQLRRLTGDAQSRNDILAKRVISLEADLAAARGASVIPSTLRNIAAILSNPMLTDRQANERALRVAKGEE